MTASSATGSTTTQHPTAVVVALVGLLALMVVAFGSVVDAYASTPAAAPSHNAVAASTISDTAVVAPSQTVRPGECRARAPDYDGSAVGFCVAPNTAGLATRADELHGALDPIAQTRRTTTVMSTREGGDVLAGGVRDLTPAQRALARPGDVLGKLPGEHAEITALKAAGEAGLTPQGIATTTNICPACRAALEEAGATITGPRSAWWWR